MVKIIRISTVPSSLYGLLEGQLRMLAKYYEIVAVSSPGKELCMVGKREGVRVVAVPMERHISLLKDFKALVRLCRVFIKEKPRMIHSITPKAGLLSMMAGMIARVPIRMHTFTGLVFPTSKGFMKKLLILTDKLTCACATHINPEGEGVRKDLISYRITKKPLCVIANGNVNGVDVEYFKMTEDVKIKSANYISSCFTYIFVGRVVRDKGINELVRAFCRLSAENKHVRLFILGTFEEHLDPVSEDVKVKMKNNSSIEYCGYQQDIRPFLAASNVLVLPSYREGFPNVVIQAGAMSLPCIVTDINGSNEIIIHKKNGIIIPSHDEEALYKSMKYAVEHQLEMKAMGENARPLVVERYERHMVWEALLEEYHKLLWA